MKLKEIYIAQWSKKEQKDFMNEILEEYNECFKPIVEEWLKQKPSIDSHLCKQFCKMNCKLCYLDDAISRKELLKELQEK